MDSFLDSTIIIKYLEYDYIKEHLRKKCFDYIKSSNGKILISFIIKEELRRAILKRKEIYDYVLKKMNDSSYELDYVKTISLNKEDSIFAKNLYLKLKEKDAIKLKKDFDSEIGFLNVSLSIFLKNKVNEIAIEKADLDSFLLNVVHEFINDFADCRVLSSAIQMQKNREGFIFVTADKHFSPNDYKFITEEQRLKDYKFPNLRNFLYED